MLKLLVSVFVLFGIWVVLSGTTTPFTLAVGVAVAIVSVLAFRDPIAGERWLGRRERVREAPDEPRSFSRRMARLVAGLALGPVFLWKVFVSGVVMAFYALRPNMDFWPGIVRVRGGMRSITGTALFANLLTLTPGTLTIDYDEDGDALYVHWIDVTGYGEETFDKRVTSGLRSWLERLDV